jgi:hypothetical protein
MIIFRPTLGVVLSFQECGSNLEGKSVLLLMMMVDLCLPLHFWLVFATYLSRAFGN